MPPTSINADARLSPLAGTRDDWAGASKYLPTFIDEAQNTIDEIADALLAWEAGGNPAGARQSLVAAHRLKGSAASIGLNRVAKIAHLTEDLLQGLLDGGEIPTPDAGETLLAFADGLREYLNRLRSGETGDDRLDALAERLSAADGSPRTTSTTEHDSEIGRDLHRRVAAAVCEDQRGATLVGKVVFERNFPLVGLKARLLYEKLANLGTVRYFDPPAEGIENLDELGAVHFGLVTENSPETVRRRARMAGIERISVEPLAAETRGDIAPEPVPADALRQKPAETIRVEVERLDRMMNHAGRLAMSKSRLTRIACELKPAAAGNRQAEILVAELDEEIQSLERVSDEMRRGILDLRMVPIGPLLARFHRVVRDVALAGGKNIRLTVRGENTELDKRMIDELGDPLIHLVRNAADHGVESPEDRVAAGKPPQGAIDIEAFHRGGNVVVRLADDGRGIDVERLREKAVEKGLLSAADAAEMDRRRSLRLVWLPGLSTADKISDVSGRGMGMDIVRAKIEQLGGTIELESEPGRGTAASIKLPLTLAILPCLMAEIGGDPWAVPLESVAEIVVVQGRDATEVLGRPTALVRDRVVPIVTPADLFGENRERRGDGPIFAADKPIGEATPLAPPANDDRLLVVIGQGRRQLGLRVDRVLGEEDVVIKSLAANWRDVPGIAGASIHGDGRVCLILDPAVLIDNQTHRGINHKTNPERVQ